MNLAEYSTGNLTPLEIAYLDQYGNYILSAIKSLGYSPELMVDLSQSGIDVLKDSLTHIGFYINVHQSVSKVTRTIPNLACFQQVIGHVVLCVFNQYQKDSNLKTDRLVKEAAQSKLDHEQSLIDQEAKRVMRVDFKNKTFVGYRYQR